MKIKNISINDPKPTWDIEVPEVHHYIMSNGCVSHNSAKNTNSYESFEPIGSNLFNRRVLGGEYVIVNKYLIQDLEDLGIWGEDFKNELIMNEGSIQNINFAKYIAEDKNYDKKIKRIEHLLVKYKTIWEISQRELIDMAADRGPFVDQSQSMNIYMANPTLGKITSSHNYAHQKGLKTGVYYLRTKAISTGAKHLAIDTSKVISNETQSATAIEYRGPEDSLFNCDGCSA